MLRPRPSGEGPPEPPPALCWLTLVGFPRFRLHWAAFLPPGTFSLHIVRFHEPHADFSFQEKLFLQSCTLFFPSQHRHIWPRACSCMLASVVDPTPQPIATSRMHVIMSCSLLQSMLPHSFISCFAANDMKSFRAIIPPPDLHPQLFCVLMRVDSSWSEGRIDATLVELSSTTQPVLSSYIAAVSFRLVWRAAIQRVCCPDDCESRIQETGHVSGFSGGFSPSSVHDNLK